MANHLGKILDFLEIPQVKLAEFLGITPQALSSIIQSENTKKYNEQLADFLHLNIDVFNEFLTTTNLKKSQLLRAKLAYLAKDEKDLVEFGFKNEKLSDEIEIESILEDIRDILIKDQIEGEAFVDTGIIQTVVDSIIEKYTKYGIIEYSIVRDFMLMLNKVTKSEATFKLDTYQNILSFINSIKIPEHNSENSLKEYMKLLKKDKE
jgi:transcriptional regulator with XRE-family HTH domain